MVKSFFSRRFGSSDIPGKLAQAGSLFADERSIGRLDEAARQRHERTPMAIVDADEQTQVAAGLVVPEKPCSSTW